MAISRLLAASKLAPLPLAQRRLKRPFDNASDALNGHQRLAFEMESQQRENWCWAAVAVSVAKFYRSATAWTQGTLAYAVLTNEHCDPDGLNPGCDLTAYPEDALAKVRCLRATKRNSIFAFTRLRSEISSQRCVACRVKWRFKAGAHVVVIVGVRSDGVHDRVHVCDPKSGEWIYDYEEFCSRYRGQGVWHDTYFTKTPDE